MRSRIMKQRERLHPFILQQHALHLKQARELMVSHHKAALREMDDWIDNIERALSKETTSRQPIEQE